MAHAIKKTSKSHCSHTKYNKYRYLDDNGNYLSAGGILFYDDNGIWTVGESNTQHNIVYNDPGGKYNFEDCDIFRTIVRELAEETYNSIELTRSQLLKIITQNKIRPVYVNGHNRQPVYVCYVIPLSLVSDLIKFDTDIFHINYVNTLVHNSFIKNKYIVKELKYLTFDDLKMDKHPLGFRLKKILSLHDILKSKLN